VSDEVARTGGEIEAKTWTREEVIAAFVNGTIEQRQAIANQHAPVVRETGPLFDVEPGQWL